MQNPVREAAAALIRARDHGTYRAELDAFAALRAALALPAPEPAPHWQFRVSLLDELSAGSGREREAATAIRQMADALHWWRDNAPLYAEPPAPREPKPVPFIGRTMLPGDAAAPSEIARDAARREALLLYSKVRHEFYMVRFDAKVADERMAEQFPELTKQWLAANAAIEQERNAP
jgi:hypothetical protein